MTSGLAGKLERAREAVARVIIIRANLATAEAEAERARMAVASELAAQGRDLEELTALLGEAR
jgi:hypothetical protein